MDQLTQIWETVKQLVTSRTIWGVFVMILGALGIHPADEVPGAIVEVGDQFVLLAGAVLALIGYLDRRPKPGMLSVVRPNKA